MKASLMMAARRKTGRGTQLYEGANISMTRQAAKTAAVLATRTVTEEIALRSGPLVRAVRRA